MKEGTRYKILNFLLNLIFLAIGAVLLWIDMRLFLLYFFLMFTRAIDTHRRDSSDSQLEQTAHLQAHLEALTKHHKIPKEEIEGNILRLHQEFSDLKYQMLGRR